MRRIIYLNTTKTHKKEQQAHPKHLMSSFEMSRSPVRHQDGQAGLESWDKWLSRGMSLRSRLPQQRLSVRQPAAQWTGGPSSRSPRTLSVCCWSPLPGMMNRHNGAAVWPRGRGSPSKGDTTVSSPLQQNNKVLKGKLLILYYWELNLGLKHNKQILTELQAPTSLP